MGLFCTISEINNNFGQKSQNFPQHICFCAPADGFPLEFGHGAQSQKTRVMGLPDGQKIKIGLTI